MAVVIYNSKDYVQDGDVFIVKLLTDQNITMFYRCIYLDDEGNKSNDKLLIFNFENHWKKDNIFIPCGDACVKKDIIIEAIKKRWDCGTEIEFIENDNLVINISRK